MSDENPIVRGGRLPNRYVIILPDDPAIDWKASAQKLGVSSKEHDTSSKLEQACRREIERRRVFAFVPVASRTGESVTEYWCTDLDQDTMADLYRYAIDRRDASKLALEACRAAIVEIKHGKHGDKITDLTQWEWMAIGGLVYSANLLSGTERDF